MADLLVSVADSFWSASLRHCLPSPRTTSPFPLANDRTAGTAWTLYLVRLSRQFHLKHPYSRVQWAISTFQDKQNDLEASGSCAATSTCFWLTTLALTPTDIRHRHCGGISKNTATDRVANFCHRSNTTDGFHFFPVFLLSFTIAASCFSNVCTATVVARNLLHARHTCLNNCMFVFGMD